MRHLQFRLLAIHVLFAVAVASTAILADDPAQPSQAARDDRPFLALWRHDDGFRRNSEAPYLRFAIWNDGRALFSATPEKWGHDLRVGRISEAKVKLLKSAIEQTGCLTLKGTCYLVPDAPSDCLMVDLGDGQQQMLYWDEVEVPNYGINTNPKPHHLEFMRCWKALNQLGLLSLLDEGEDVVERSDIPDHWYLKQPIQSE